MSEYSAPGMLDGGYTFTEGSAVDKEGNVSFTDQPKNRIIKCSGASKKATVFLDGTANGGEGAGRSKRVISIINL